MFGGIYRGGSFRGGLTLQDYFLVGCHYKKDNTNTSEPVPVAGDRITMYMIQIQSADKRLQLGVLERVA